MLCFRDMSDITKGRLLNYFAQGYSATAARHALKAELMLEHPEDHKSTLEDGSYFPSLSIVQHLLYQFQRNNSQISLGDLSIDAAGETDSLTYYLGEVSCDAVDNTGLPVVNNAVCDTVGNTLCDVVDNTICDYVENTMCDAQDNAISDVGNTVFDVVDNTLCDIVDIICDMDDPACVNFPLLDVSESPECFLVDSMSDFVSHVTEVPSVEVNPNLEEPSVLIPEATALLLELRELHQRILNGLVENPTAFVPAVRKMLLNAKRFCQTEAGLLNAMENFATSPVPISKFVKLKLVSKNGKKIPVPMCARSMSRRCMKRKHPKSDAE